MKKLPKPESWKNELEELIDRKKEENEILKKLQGSMQAPVSELHKKAVSKSREKK